MSLSLLVLRRSYHYAIYVLGGGVILLCAVALSLKFWFLPDIGQYQADLEQAASRAAGVPVRIGHLEADWYGLNPRLSLHGLRMQPKEGPPLLLPRVDAIVSWLSLPLLELRLARLDVVAPQLTLRRDSEGVIHLAGIPINQESEPSPFPDWLLRQPRLVVKDARIEWRDEKLDAPPLVFERVRLLVQNRFGRHRLGGVAYPNDGLARLELRGDLKGGPVREPASWSGELYARIDGARFDAWRQWVPWGQQAVKSGAGDMRFWLGVEAGQIISLEGDARLTDLAVNLEAGLPDMALTSLSGRLGWARRDGSNAFFVKGLRFRALGGAESEPADLRVNLLHQTDGSLRRLEAQAQHLRLEPFIALTGALPLPRPAHDLIEELAPRGLIEEADGHWAGAGDYRIKLALRDAGLKSRGGLPGVSGVSARLTASEKGGEVELDSRRFGLEWDRMFRHPLGLDELKAEAVWRRKADRLELEFQVDKLANADLAGKVRGTLTLPHQGATQADITGRFHRGKANAVYRYLPRVVADDAYLWLKRGLLSGGSDDVRLTLKGSLDRFPFDKGGGEFRVSVRMRDGVLDYAPRWPRIEGVRGQLEFHGMAMTLLADQARIMNAELGPVRAEIPDLHYSPDEMLLIEGRARGRTQDFLDFIRASPVHDYTGRATEPMRAEGSGDLALKLRIPLRHSVDSTVSGNFAFQGNRLLPGGDLPELADMRGVLSFTERGLKAEGIQTRVLGLPADLALDSQPGGQVRARLGGRASAEQLRPHLPAVLAARIAGSAPWRAELGVTGSAEGLSISSDLTGLSLDLPAPLGKPAERPMALSVSKTPAGLQARYGQAAHLRASHLAEATPWVNARLGAGDAAVPAEPGLTLSGTQPQLDLDAWRSLATGVAGNVEKTGEALPLRLDLRAQNLKVLDRRLHDARLQLAPSGANWRAQVASREIVGEAVVSPGALGHRVQAQFQRLQWGGGEETADPAAAADTSLSLLASLDLEAERFVWKGKDLGHLELRLQKSPGGPGFEVGMVKLASADGVLRGSGQMAARIQQPTRLNLSLDSPDMGKLLTRLGHPGALRGGETHVEGALTWMGGVEEFRLEDLQGNLKLKLGKGQFLKVEPGAARLLGLLSLQSLTRRLFLDFRDIFSEGFAFDEIVGDLRLAHGVASTTDTVLRGPAARVGMKGSVDLIKETQDLRLTIQPRLDDTLAVAGALLGGPAVGIGTFLANKLLKNPIGEAVTFEYDVTGAWAEPQVNKLVRPVRASPYDAGDAAP